MKLSEVIKAIEDGDKNVFINGDFTFTHSTVKNRVYVESTVDYCNFTLCLDGWEEVKPPRQWSEKELMLFKLLPDWAKWIAADEGSDDVFVFENKPEIENIIFFQNETDKHDYKLLEKEIFDFLTITFEESPIYIGDLKGE